MGQTATQSVATRGPTINSQDQRRLWFDLSMQFNFLVFFVSTSWYMFGPEATNRTTNLIELVVMGLSFLVSAWLWLGSTKLPVRSRVGLVSGSAIILGLIGLQLVFEYEESYRVLKPPRIENGRIIHDAMGLSYALLPDWSPELEPRLTMNANSPTPPDRRLPDRLACGQSAMIGRQIHRPTGTSSAIPSLITVEVEHDRSRVLNRFIRLIRSREMDLSQFSNIKMVQHTRDRQINGRHMVEYEFFEDRQKFYSRNVHLQSGKFILTFILNSSTEADRERFDEFLKTVRIDSPFQLEQLFQ